MKRLRCMLVHIAPTPTPAEGVLLSNSSLMGMCCCRCWTGWYMMPRWGRTLTTGLTINGAAFSTELLEWGHTFSEFGGLDSSSHLRLANVRECFQCR